MPSNYTALICVEWARNQNKCRGRKSIKAERALSASRNSDLRRSANEMEKGRRAAGETEVI